MTATVNYSPLKQGACPWRYATKGVSETFGRLTTALPGEPGSVVTEVNPTVEILRTDRFLCATPYRQVVKVLNRCSTRRLYPETTERSALTLSRV